VIVTLHTAVLRAGSYELSSAIENPSVVMVSDCVQSVVKQRSVLVSNTNQPRGRSEAWMRRIVSLSSGALRR